MKIRAIFIGLCFLLSTIVYAQSEKENFTITKEIKHLPVISQGSTGTCWSFATTSFFESEIIRKGFPETDLSEMYFVYLAYQNKAKQFMYYHGNNSFSQGGQAHDVINVIRENGLATFNSFPGKMVDGRYRHRDLVKSLNEEVEALNKKRKDFNAADVQSLEPILNDGIGKIPKKVKTSFGKIKPTVLRDKLQINPDDYVELSSFSHHPFYQPFVLEVPDNWAHGMYYNLPIDELMKVMYFALNNGYTVAWDGDTSEKTFQHKKGKADLPKKQIGKVDQQLRQETFNNRTTTDDHLMHIVGLSKDQEGRNCFYTKNSWGAKSNDFGGYLHLTDDYVRLKTIAILVHKDAIPKEIRAKLKL